MPELPIEQRKVLDDDIRLWSGDSRGYGTVILWSLRQRILMVIDKLLVTQAVTTIWF